MHKNIRFKVFFLFTIFSFIAISQNTQADECTTVIVEYGPDTPNWYASANYTACGEPNQHWSAWIINYSGQSISVKSGSPFAIGPMGTTTVLKELFPTGQTFYVTCNHPLDRYPVCFEGKLGKSKSNKSQKSQSNEKAPKPKTK